MELQYYVIDTETTGIKPLYHEMTEIGIIRCKDRVQLCRNIKCEYPERANYDALRITNKTLEDLKNGLDKYQVVEDCNKFFEEDGATPAHRVIVAHNASFDKRFLHALWTSCDKQFPATMWLDTISLTRDFAKKQGIKKPKVNLHAACDLVGIKKIASAHSAKVDSRNTYFLYKNLVEDKKIDYLPFIKTEPHIVSSSYDEADLSILEDI